MATNSRRLPSLHVEYRLYVPDPDRKAPGGKIQRHILIDIHPSLLSKWEVDIMDGTGPALVGDEMNEESIRNFVDAQMRIMLGWLVVWGREVNGG